MRLGIDDILAAHGVGAGLGPYFGNGSDGAFNPTPGPAPVNVSVTVAPDGVIYGGNGTGVWPGGSGHTTITYWMPLSFTFSGTQANGATNTPVAAQQSTSGWGGNTASMSLSYTWGVKFTVSSQVTLSGAGWYNIVSNSASLTCTIWDNSGNNLGAASTTANTASAWSNVTFGTPIQLQPGTTYWISVTNISGLFSSGILLDQVVNAPPMYWNVTTAWTPVALDGAPIVKQFSSFNLPTGNLVTVSERCQGLVLLVQGDVNISGEIIMDYLGALADPTQTPGQTVATSVDSLYFPVGNNKFVVIGPGGAGGAGGAGGSYQSGSGPLNCGPGGNGGQSTNGTWWGGGRGGGGGGGGVAGGNASTGAGIGGNGGNASYTGTSVGATPPSPTGTSVYAGTNGTNGGGGSGSTAQNSTAGKAGAGGIGLGGGGGGGSGSYGTGSVGTNGSNSSQAPGGMILIICGGSITINSNAVLSANGGSGGNGGSYTYAAAAGGGGGGAGGGVVALLYRNNYTNSGTITVNGGSGGMGGAGAPSSSSYAAGINGFNGNNGQLQVVKLS